MRQTIEQAVKKPKKINDLPSERLSFYQKALPLVKHPHSGPMKKKYDLKLDNGLTTANTQVFKVRITGIAMDSSVSETLNLLRDISQKNLTEKFQGWLVHPALKKTSQPDINFGYFEPSLKLNRLFAEHGSLLQQIEYLFLMGITDAIGRHPSFQAAITYYKFCLLLSETGITNPSFSAELADPVVAPINIIHAVHPTFLNDNEIRSGLHISLQANAPESKCDESNNQVIFVCSPETLDLALFHCAPHSKLIIDGHWEHGKKTTHGVWEAADAAYIGNELSELIRRHPGKVKSLHLWGCEAGSLPLFENLPESFNPERLTFKDESLPHFNNREMADFRNRAVYYSKKGEFPYAENSLAGQVMLHLTDPSVSVTATSSRTYPFPPAQKAKFNIGSDSKQWEGPHFWSESHAEVPAWYLKLHRLKSITVMQSTDNKKRCHAALWSRNDPVVEASIDSWHTAKLSAPPSPQ